MDSIDRREAMVNKIKDSTQPLTGSYLAKLYGVSRQVIVQDIAILRAAGQDIIATPQGYIYPATGVSSRCERVLACIHSCEGIEEELMTIVDLGGRVDDVIIEHPVYGEFKAQLMLKSPSDVRSFIARMNELQAEPLSSLTEGVHLHTIGADSVNDLDRIQNALRDKGFLLDDRL